MATDTAAQYHVYDNGGSGPIDYGTIVATVDGTSWTSPAIAAAGSYAWAVRAVDPDTSLEEQNVDQRVSLVIDAGLADVTNLPLAPVALTVIALAGGDLLVQWHAIVDPRDTRKPTSFAVCVGTGGTPNYASPALTVRAYASVTHYQAVVRNLTPGTAYTVGVRAVNTTGTEANTTTRTITADATPPENVSGLSSSLV